MKYLPISKLPVTEEADATGEVAQAYDDLKAMLGVPAMDVADLALAGSPAALISRTRLFQGFMEHATLPQPLLFMIHYAISSAKKCKCCSSNLQQACRSVGIDDDLLEALVNNLPAVNPKRVQEIIKFAVQCALNPQGLTEADYDRVRDQGVSNEELVEIIGWTAFAVYNDTLADAMKLDDPQQQQVIET